MKKAAVITVIVVFGVFVWSIASRLSADAVGMAVGLAFGALAGIPTALLVLAAGRRGQRVEEDEEEDEYPPYAKGRLPQHACGQPGPYQAPVIVLAAPSAPPQPWPQHQTVDSIGYPVRQALPGPGAPAPPGGRAFKVVGEKEEWIEEW